jgi:hypothetical protein
MLWVVMVCDGCFSADHVMRMLFCFPYRSGFLWERGAAVHRGCGEEGGKLPGKVPTASRHTEKEPSLAPSPPPNRVYASFMDLIIPIYSFALYLPLTYFFLSIIDKGGGGNNIHSIVNNPSSGYANNKQWIKPMPVVRDSLYYGRHRSGVLHSRCGFLGGDGMGQPFRA